MTWESFAEARAAWILSPRDKFNVKTVWRAEVTKPRLLVLQPSVIEQAAQNFLSRGRRQTDPKTRFSAQSPCLVRGWFVYIY